MSYFLGRSGRYGNKGEEDTLRPQKKGLVAYSTSSKERGEERHLEEGEET